MKGTLAILLTGLAVGLSGARAEESVQESEAFRVGYSGRLFTEASIRDAEVAIELWARQVTASMGKRMIPRIVLLDDREEMVQAVRNGEVDLLSVSTLDYLEIRDRVPLEPALTSIIVGKEIEQEFILLVRRDREVGSLEALRGGRLMVERGKSENSVARLWLDSRLLKAGLEETEGFFGGVRQVAKTSQAVFPVFFGQADAALVRKSAFDTLTELNPQLEQTLTALVTSPRLLPALVCLLPEGDAEKKRVVQEGALALHQDARGQQILTLFHVDRIVPFRKEMIESVVGLMKEYEALKERSGGDK